MLTPCSSALAPKSQIFCRREVLMWTRGVAPGLCRNNRTHMSYRGRGSTLSFIHQGAFSQRPRGEGTQPSVQRSAQIRLSTRIWPLYDPLSSRS